MIQIDETIAKLAFDEISTCQSHELKTALTKILDELGITYEYGYLAEFWHENTQFKLIGYIHEPPATIKEVYDRYYHYDSTKHQYQPRSFHHDSTLFKYLLKGRDHPLAPELIPDFFEGEKSEHISRELKKLLKGKGFDSFGPVIFMPYVGKQGRYFIAMLKLENQIAVPLFYLPSSLVGFAAYSKSLVPFIQSNNPMIWESICWILRTLKNSLGVCPSNNCTVFNGMV